MTVSSIFRPAFLWAGAASLALTFLPAQADAQTIGNARPVLPQTPAASQAGMPIRTGATDPVDTLSMHLRTLAVAPRSLSALLGAGEAALAVGDPNAAVGFFARAEQVDTRNGRAKAGLGSALVMMERADDALPLFAQAVSLGIPEAEIARDRGLAYDLRGDSRRAQRDYQLVLKRAPDDETTRRYALSLGISGDRAQALKLLEPLIKKQDQSAWRARAFILAMNGDVAGANGIARQVMPANLAATMAPFLSRLPQLNAADKAHAVAFGTMPSAGTNMASVEIGDPFHAIGGGQGGQPGSAADGLIPTGDPFGPGPDDARTARAAVPLSREPRRRPGRETVTMAAPWSVPLKTAEAAPAKPLPRPAPLPAILPQVLLPTAPDRRVGARVALVDRTKLPPEAIAVPAARQMARVTLVPGGVLPPPSAAAPAVATPVPVIVQVAPPMVSDMIPAFETAPIHTTPRVVGPTASAPAALAVAPTPLPAPAPIPTPAQVAPKPAPMSRLASILAGLTPEMESAAVALPTAAEAKAARRVAQRKAVEAAATAADLKAQKEAQAALVAEARRNPARLWVQVATGNNERGLPTTWNRIRDDNETALKGRSAWSVPFKATNRLLVGPMKSPADARALVNTLAKGGVSANMFSSEAGQEVTRVGGK
ncbi:SPOR domain-containing protein [Sphingomonas sp.]|uniref:tetratricopeptide repeat protein n=1 Tax=Sphingomonas sp. TaxID=28214 RepID=UPI002600A0AF|nr:SPOR domain-containing protein [Sphingomonas sp.]